MAPVLSVRGLAKAYGGVPALRDVTLALKPGEIRAICGENGAGKSTFVKLLMGVVAPDAGTVAVDGVARTIRGVRDAQRLGLGLVAQELSLAPHLSVLDNIWLGHDGVPLFHRRAALRRRAGEAMAALGVGDWPLDRPVATLGVGQRQIVEIARLLARDARVLILDEPTATLSDVEIGRLLDLLRGLRRQGRSVLYISHRLGEVFDLCDSVTVFRNGETVAAALIGDVSRDGLIEAMLGRPVRDMYPPRQACRAAGGLGVDGLVVPGTVEGVSFMAPRGRITCLAGQVGSGATTVVRAIAGLIEEARGGITVDGRPLTLGAARDAAARGVTFVTDDRGGEGVFQSAPVRDNLVATHLAACSRAGVVGWPRLGRLAARLAASVDVPERRLPAPARTLSGGNQQKLVFARAVGRNAPGVLLMNEPTRGVDVGARAEIYRLMRALCEAGHALVMASSDLEEVVGMADAVLTMHRGRIIGRYEGGAIRVERILHDIAGAPRSRAA